MNVACYFNRADYEANFERTLQNSKRIHDIAQDYYQAKVENKNHVIVCFIII